MKLITFLLAILLPVLLIAACHGGDDQDDCSKMFGGPYPENGNFRDGEAEDILAQKGLDFMGYKNSGFTFSQATVLADLKQLETSVEANLSSPRGVTSQLYNYVISPDCEIIVGTWTKDISRSELNAVLTEGNCIGGRDFIRAASKDTMINFLPEDLGKQFRTVDERDRQSPCWQEGRRLVDGVDDNRGDGVLDALSKHFMFAQGIDDKGVGKSIADFPALDSSGKSQWADKQVAYAGEIFVDLTSCTFSLNAGSGTYRPLEEHLVNVTRFFAKKVSDNSMKISGVEPWC